MGATLKLESQSIEQQLQAVNSIVLPGLAPKTVTHVFKHLWHLRYLHFGCLAFALKIIYSNDGSNDGSNAVCKSLMLGAFTILAVVHH